MNYYISDTHFGHANIIRFDHRPFANTNEMEHALIKNWNERVTKDDVVYIIGDFCWGTEKEWLRVLNQLNGAKVLVRGNHDLKHPSATLKSKFRKICDYEEITDNGIHIIMSHYPHLFYKSSYNGDTWHFCGHTHNRTSEEFQRRNFVRKLIADRKADIEKNGNPSYFNRGQIINVGCMMDYMNFMPRTADELIAWWHSYYEK